MKNEYLKFLPLSILYLILIVLISSNTLQGDEKGYVAYANRLSLGTYFPQLDISLWWGPGYPIILTPFVHWKLPLIAAKLLNSIFLLGAVIYFYKSLDLYIKKKYATILAFLLGLYPPLLREIHLLMTESFVFFLVCGFMYHYCKIFRKPQIHWFHIFLSSMYLGYLAITKIFFGYVILASILLYSFLFVWQRKEWFMKTTLINLLALTFCIPFLLITYLYSGKIFYWGTSGGMSLYWMSSPYNSELGDWFSFKDVEERPELSQHRNFFEKIDFLSNIEKDEAFKKKAVENIIEHPLKYAINWVANIGRLFFSYPFSYTPQKFSTYFYLVPNMFIFVFLALSIYPAFLRRKFIPYEIYTLTVFTLTALGGTSLLSAYDRQFRPLVPILSLWLSFLYFRVLKIEIRTENEV